jgi:hypothetical protein
MEVHDEQVKDPNDLTSVAIRLYCKDMCVGNPDVYFALKDEYSKLPSIDGVIPPEYLKRAEKAIEATREFELSKKKRVVGSALVASGMALVALGSSWFLIARFGPSAMAMIVIGIAWYLYAMYGHTLQKHN